jgi:hypothetical protein
MSFKQMFERMAQMYEEQADARRQRAYELASDAVKSGQLVRDENGKPVKVWPPEAVVMLRTASDLDGFASDIRRELKTAI